MHGHDTGLAGSGLFPVPLQGWMVECESIQDAVAVKNADAFISGRDTVVYTPVELDDLATACKRYGRHSAADILNAQASRMRAAAYLQDSIGYKGPTKR